MHSRTNQRGEQHPHLPVLTDLAEFGADLMARYPAWRFGIYQCLMAFGVRLEELRRECQEEGETVTVEQARVLAEQVKERLQQTCTAQINAN